MKKIVALALLLALFAALCPTAGADAWIPPEEYNHALVASPKEDGACYALNVFISNYAEMGRDAWAGKSPDNVCIEGLLKHFELNPGVYPDDVFSHTAEDGTRYMAVSEEKFEKRMEDLFGRRVSAREHPGYHDGYIWVTAENYGAPITIYASVTDCFADSKNYYTVAFTIYNCTDSSFTNRYGTSYYNLPENHGEKIASGIACFYYWGPTDATTFHAYEFELDYYRLNETGVPFPYSNPNVPAHSPVRSTEAPDTQGTTEPITEPPVPDTTQTPAAEVPPAAASTAPTSPTLSDRDKDQYRDELMDRLNGTDSEAQRFPAEQTSIRRILIPVLLVLVLCIAAAVVILLVFRKKKS